MGSVLLFGQREKLEKEQPSSVMSAPCLVRSQYTPVLSPGVMSSPGEIRRMALYTGFAVSWLSGKERGTPKGRSVGRWSGMGTAAAHTLEPMSVLYSWSYYH